MSQVISNAFRLIYFVLYVIGLYAHGPSWPNASIKYLSKIAANAVLVKSKVKGAINMQYN